MKRDMIDQLMTEAHANRIHEMTEQLYLEIEGLVKTMKEEHSQVTFTEPELLMLYANSIAADLQTRASQHVTAVRIQQAFMNDLQSL